MSLAISGTILHQTREGSGQQRHRLLQVLSRIDFEEGSLSAPAWEVFDSAQVNQVLKGCEKKGPQGEKVIDVQRLHKILNDELTGLQGSTALNQRQIIQDEIKRLILLFLLFYKVYYYISVFSFFFSILRYAVQWNHLQDQAAVKRNVLDAWRQVTEVLLCSVPSDILPVSSKQQLLLDLLQTLLNKVLADGTMPELANQVSGVVLLLLTALRQTYENAKDDSPSKSANAVTGAAAAAASSSSYVSILDSGTRTGTKEKRNKSVVYSTALHVILKGLIMWISNTSKRFQSISNQLVVRGVFHQEV